MQSTRHFQKLFPKETHNQANLALIFTYTQRLLDRFLALEYLQSEQEHLNLLQSLKVRKLYDYFEKKAKEGSKHLEKITQRSADFYLNRHLYLSELQAYGELQDEDTMDLILSEHKALETYFIVRKLKKSCDLLMRSRIVQTKSKGPEEDAFLDQILTNLGDFQKVPSIEIYANQYLMLTTEKHENYFKVKGMLDESADLFSKDELQSIYGNLMNFSAREINKGNGDFFKELFDLQRVQLKKELFFEDGFLSEWHYKNIVSVGLRLDESDWVENFIRAYKDRLKPDSIENAYTFNLATYHYHVSNYKEVLQLLLTVEYSDIRYALGARTLLMQTYFELEEETAFLAMVASFRQYVKRNKTISEFRKDGYYNFLKFTNRAFVVKINMAYESDKKSKKDLDKLLDNISDDKTVFYKSWLLEETKKLSQQVERA